MGLIAHVYKKQFVCRQDREVGVPFYTVSDFEGLKEESFAFVNSKNIEIKYYYFYYDNYKEDKIVLFLHGLAPGHAAYFAEINTLAKRGYKVLTLDYTGCGESQGKLLGSIFTSTKDVNELLDYLKIEKPIVLVGHSMGGFTALNTINLRKEMKKAVIISGFLNPLSIFNAQIKNNFIVSHILKYEKKMYPDYFNNINNIEYLKTTEDDLFFIHSDTDTMVPYESSMKVVEQIDNPHIKTLLIPNRKHNPNYTDEAVDYMNTAFGTFYYLIQEKKIKTDQDKIDYFKDISLPKMVEQDEELFDKIIEFIEK